MKGKGAGILRVAVILAALGAVVFGLWRGENETVFLRAVNICLECIGIG